MPLIKREAAKRVIENMTSEWVRLEDLGAWARLTNGQMARFLSEHDDVERKYVYHNRYRRSLYRKKET